jgi:microsomal dipeptidase-like Zn-dependent dipeptidase
VRKLVPGIEVFGGLILNTFTGGMNPAAVEGFAALAGDTSKVVWLPNLDSEQQIRFYKLKRTAVRVSDGQRLLPETLAVLDAIAKHKLVLATSHVSAEEALMIIREGRARGIQGIVVTHAIQDPINMTVEQMKEAVRLGAFIEHAVLGMFKGPESHLGGFYSRQRKFTIADHAAVIKAVGPVNMILATDLGQHFNPTGPDGLKAFMEGLKRAGISDADIDLMSRKNPARLLGLNP